MTLQYIMFIVAMTLFGAAQADVLKETEQRFDSEKCRTEQGSFGKQWHLILRDYDLIGMSKTKLLELIGTHDAVMGHDGEIVYTVRGFGARCGNAYDYIILRFDKSDNLSGWKFYDENSPSAKVGDSWETKNVIFEKGNHGALIEKQQ